MKPIPKALLIHTVDLQEVIGKDEWGKESLSDPVPLRYVRIEPSSRYVKDKDHNEIQLAAVLFFDCYNSRPKGQTFCDGQVLAFNGETYRIQLVEPLYDGHRLHHYELGLIRDA